MAFTKNRIAFSISFTWVFLIGQFLLINCNGRSIHSDRVADIGIHSTAKLTDLDTSHQQQKRIRRCSWYDLNCEVIKPIEKPFEDLGDEIKKGVHELVSKLKQQGNEEVNFSCTNSISTILNGITTSPCNKAAISGVESLAAALGGQSGLEIAAANCATSLTLCCASHKEADSLAFLESVSKLSNVEILSTLRVAYCNTHPSSSVECQESFKVIVKPKNFQTKRTITSFYSQTHQEIALTECYHVGAEQVESMNANKLSLKGTNNMGDLFKIPTNRLKWNSCFFTFTYQDVGERIFLISGDSVGGSSSTDEMGVSLAISAHPFALEQYFLEREDTNIEKAFKNYEERVKSYIFRWQRNVNLAWDQLGDTLLVSQM
eukprot:Awhi_evm1s3574